MRDRSSLASTLRLAVPLGGLWLSFVLASPFLLGIATREDTPTLAATVVLTAAVNAAALATLGLRFGRRALLVGVVLVSLVTLPFAGLGTAPSSPWFWTAVLSVGGGLALEAVGRRRRAGVDAADADTASDDRPSPSGGHPTSSDSPTDPDDDAG